MIRKRWIVGGILVVIGIAPLVLNYSGYCFEQGRYLSDEAIIRAAVDDVISVYPPVIDVVEMVNGQARVVGRFRPTNPVPYPSADYFFRVNEGCCELTNRDPEGYRPSLYERLTGRTATLVRVKFAVRYDDRYGNRISATDETFIAIGNCGRPWSRY